MKKLLIGLLALGSIYSYAQIYPEKHIECLDSNILNLSNDKIGTYIDERSGDKVIISESGLEQAPAKSFHSGEVWDQMCVSKKAYGSKMKYTFKSSESMWEQREIRTLSLKFKKGGILEATGCAKTKGTFIESIRTGQSHSISRGSDRMLIWDCAGRLKRTYKKL